jgi:biotin operon repressor
MPNSLLKLLVAAVEHGKTNALRWPSAKILASELGINEDAVAKRMERLGSLGYPYFRKAGGNIRVVDYENLVTEEESAQVLLRLFELRELHRKGVPEDEFVRSAAAALGITVDTVREKVRRGLRCGYLVTVVQGRIRPAPRLDYELEYMAQLVKLAQALPS